MLNDERAPRPQDPRDLGHGADRVAERHRPVVAQHDVEALRPANGVRSASAFTSENRAAARSSASGVGVRAAG